MPQLSGGVAVWLKHCQEVGFSLCQPDGLDCQKFILITIGMVDVNSFSEEGAND